MSRRDISWDEFVERKRTPITRNPYVFLAFFALIFGLLEWGYFLIPDSYLRDLIHHYAIAQPSADLLNLIAPGEAVTVDQGRLVSQHAQLRIIRGCDGSGVSFMLISAILVYPTTWRRRLFGVLAGVALVYLLNLARLVGLYFVTAYHPDQFALAHTYLLPTLFILVCLLFFSFWSARAMAEDAPGKAH